MKVITEFIKNSRDIFIQKSRLSQRGDQWCTFLCPRFIGVWREVFRESINFVSLLRQHWGYFFLISYFSSQTFPHSFHNMLLLLDGVVTYLFSPHNNPLLLGQEIFTYRILSSSTMFFITFFTTPHLPLFFSFLFI
jgi:hypothetical protein